MLTARHIWNQIGEEFNRLREKNRALAWKTYQKRLNEHGGILLEIFSGKDLVELSMKIEGELRGDSATGDGDESGLDYARKFLDGKIAEKRVH